jgi:hypothetical protein
MLTRAERQRQLERLQRVFENLLESVLEEETGYEPYFSSEISHGIRFSQLDIQARYNGSKEIGVSVTVITTGADNE